MKKNKIETAYKVLGAFRLLTFSRMLTDRQRSSIGKKIQMKYGKYFIDKKINKRVE